MNTKHDCRNEAAGRIARRVVWAAAIFLCLKGTALAVGLFSTGYALNWDQDVEKTSTETSDTRTLRHTLDLNYKGFLSPVVENEITLKIEQEVKSDADPKSTTKVFPSINLFYKGSYWNAGAKRTIDDSNLPGTNRKIADSYFMELFYEPPLDTLPDLKAKYTLDQDYESGAEDTSQHMVTLSSAYQPMEWVEFKGEYKRDVTDDNLKADSDTENETYSGTVSIRHFISDKIRMSSEFRTETKRGATLLDSGGAENQKEDQTHTWKNVVSFRPGRQTNIDGSYDFDLKQDIVSGKHIYAKTWRLAVTQSASIFSLTGDFNRKIDEERHTTDENEKTQDTWSLSSNAKFSKHLDFSAKYQKTESQETYIQDPSKDTTSGSVNVGATWTGQITPFWKASAKYDKTDTIDKGVTTTVGTKYNFQSTFDFKAFNLLLEPLYDITRTDDRQLDPPEETEIRDFRFRIAWKMFSTNNMEANVGHTYGRKTDSGAGTIERTDNSTGILTWNAPLPGLNVGFDVTRSAVDTSEDDQPPDITSTFGFKLDYRYRFFNWNLDYKYDKKSLTDNSETFNFKLGWRAPRWGVSFTYRFDKTFSVVLDESYSIGLAFKVTI